MPATIVPFTDGATTQGIAVGAAADLATDASVAVSTITFGTDAGTVTIDGETVPPDTTAMIEVVDATGGAAPEAG